MNLDEKINQSGKKITCPRCNHNFTWGDSQISEQQKAIIVLSNHQFSIRAIGKMMNLHPESISYRIRESKKNKYVKEIKEITK